MHFKRLHKSYHNFWMEQSHVIPCTINGIEMEEAKESKRKDAFYSNLSKQYTDR